MLDVWETCWRRDSLTVAAQWQWVFCCCCCCCHNAALSPADTGHVIHYTDKQMLSWTTCARRARHTQVDHDRHVWNYHLWQWLHSRCHYPCPSPTYAFQCSAAHWGYDPVFLMIQAAVMESHQLVRHCWNQCLLGLGSKKENCFLHLKVKKHLLPHPWETYLPCFKFICIYKTWAIAWMDQFSGLIYSMFTWIKKEIIAHTALAIQLAWITNKLSRFAQKCCQGICVHTGSKHSQ